VKIDRTFNQSQGQWRKFEQICL